EERELAEIGDALATSELRRDEPVASGRVDQELCACGLEPALVARGHRDAVGVERERLDRNPLADLGPLLGRVVEEQRVEVRAVHLVRMAPPTPLCDEIRS